MASGSQNMTSYQANKWTNLRTFTIGSAENNVDGTSDLIWSTDEILGGSGTDKFLRADKEWTNILTGAFFANNITSYAAQYIINKTADLSTNNNGVSSGEIYTAYDGKDKNEKVFFSVEGIIQSGGNVGAGLFVRNYSGDTAKSWNGLIIYADKDGNCWMTMPHRITTAVYINVSTDVTGTGDAGSLIIGNKASTNLGLDDNEIMARNNKNTSTLNLNIDNSTDGDHLASVAIGNTNDTSAQCHVRYSTASSSTTTGALRVNGGVGIGGKIHVGNNAFIQGTVIINVGGASVDITRSNNAAATNGMTSNQSRVLQWNDANGKYIGRVYSRADTDGSCHIFLHAGNWYGDTPAQKYKGIDIRLTKTGDFSCLIEGATTVSGTITGTYLYSKHGTIDITQSNNGLTADTGYGFYGLDKNGKYYTRALSYALTTGETRLYLHVRNHTGSAYTAYGGIIIKAVKTSNDISYEVSNPANFRSAISAPSTTGDGASGTWGISITGNAATADKWKTKRTLTIGGTGKDVDGSGNVSWTKAEILGSSDTTKFYRGDQSWSNTISNEFKIARTTTDWKTGATLTFNTTMSNTTGYSYIASYQTPTASTYNDSLVIVATGGCFIGGGEGAETIHQNVMSGSGTEDLYLCPDGSIRIYTGADSKTQRAVIDSTPSFYPATTGTGTIGTSSYRWNGIYSTTGNFSDNVTIASGKRIGCSGGSLYIGNSGNESWVYVQDMASQDSSKWKLHQNGNAEFTGTVGTGAINANGDLNLYTSSADSPDIVWWYADKGKEQARLWMGSGFSSKAAPNFREYKSDGTSLYSGVLPLGDGTGASGTWGINVTGYSKSVLDSGNNSSTTTFAYSKAGLAYADYTWLAGWNGYELRAVNKSQFAQASHSHNDKLNSWVAGTAGNNSILVTHTSTGSDSSRGQCFAFGNGNGTPWFTEIQYGSTYVRTIRLSNGMGATSFISATQFAIISTPWDQVTICQGPGSTGAITAVATGGANYTANGSNYRAWIEGNAVTGAVWNDYAENREAINAIPGQCVYEIGDDTLKPTEERLSHFAGIVSDTWGFSQGETEMAKTPIAVAGRVLAYTYRSRDEYKPGDVLCAAPGGTVDIMTREEIQMYPDRIVGTVSCVPDYETWGGGEMADREPVEIDGRIWVKVK